MRVRINWEGADELAPPRFDRAPRPTQLFDATIPGPTRDRLLAELRNVLAMCGQCTKPWGDCTCDVADDSVTGEVVAGG